jgi:hypothetical protein
VPRLGLRQFQRSALAFELLALDLPDSPIYGADGDAQPFGCGPSLLVIIERGEPGEVGEGFRFVGLVRFLRRTKGDYVVEGGIDRRTVRLNIFVCNLFCVFFVLVVKEMFFRPQNETAPP